VLTEREKKYFDFTLEKAHQTALLTITEKRAKDAAQADAVVLEKRAREIYQLAEPAAHKSELRADFQNILFDLQARSFVETAERITAAQKALAAGVAFDEIVAQYSDEKGAAEHKGWARKINARALDGRLGRVIFDELKPGEYSTPIASRVGIHIVKLHAIEQPVKLPFDTVKPALIQKLVQERGKNAQRDLMQALSSSSTSFNDAEISKLYAPIDPIAIERARQISLESAKQARDFAKQVK
jgi:parvulin-like peptidyl-prolyl isomerase